ncbi:ornithine cyclodeaminase [Virgibacillus phasianinus]|uniref:Ornithine cyclodeaminase n=1 Tax=Virgibacillus phasianinus TaxID=2017483 RepID=A0A220U3H7_9BACI|nr:ornithine cyclodeaminase [Virgibacillus phasianinus]ASK62476.1 ornithine cyclodeaminase [Virgibacillus phasianinus]
MLVISEEAIKQNYFMDDAISDLKKGLHSKKGGLIDSPERTVIDIPAYQASSLYMPSADLSQDIASVKAVTIFPDNPAKGKPTTQGVLMLTDATTGEHLCLMNASYLTRLRTGALSGIGTDKLARRNSKVLGVIGTGAMAFEQVLGVLAVRDMETIILFNRTKEKAKSFKEKLNNIGVGMEVYVEENVDEVVTESDIICCSTRSDVPVFKGADLKSGTHINGIGSYLATMREVDLTTIQKASKIVVDDLAGVKEEAGELIHADENSDWSFSKLYGELSELNMSDKKIRESDEEITFFKSVGAAYFDLVVAKGVYMKALEKGFGNRIEI